MFKYGELNEELLDRKVLWNGSKWKITSISMNEVCISQVEGQSFILSKEEANTMLTFIDDEYNIDNLPNGKDYIGPEIIVSAATRFGDLVIPSVRHYDALMWNILDELDDCTTSEMPEQEQGFVTSRFRFVDRYEAWKIAKEQKQIVCRVGGDTAKGGCLYSENLY